MGIARALEGSFSAPIDADFYSVKRHFAAFLRDDLQACHASAPLQTKINVASQKKIGDFSGLL